MQTIVERLGRGLADGAPVTGDNDRLHALGRPPAREVAGGEQGPTRPPEPGHGRQGGDDPLPDQHGGGGRAQAHGRACGNPTDGLARHLQIDRLTAAGVQIGQLDGCGGAFGVADPRHHGPSAARSAAIDRQGRGRMFAQIQDFGVPGHAASSQMARDQALHAGIDAKGPQIARGLQPEPAVRP